MRTISYRDAIREALIEEMENDQNVVIYGQDVSIYGGPYQVTKGLLERFGNKRVRNAPLSESAMTGAAIGAAIAGIKPICEIMVMDWFGLTLDQLINQATLTHTWAGQVTIPMVIRTQGGGGVSGGAHHSKMLEVWPAYIPGIKIIMPSCPYDAKGLLKSSIRDNSPVIFIESRTLYGKKGPVPEKEYFIEIGSANIVKEGLDVTIIAFHTMVEKAIKAAEILLEEGINAEIIDPRTLTPLDFSTISTSIKKTGRAIVIHNSWKRFGIGAEIAALIQENLFNYLKSPVVRIGVKEIPIPASPSLEKLILPNENDIIKETRKMFSFNKN